MMITAAPLLSVLSGGWRDTAWDLLAAVYSCIITDILGKIESGLATFLISIRVIGRVLFLRPVITRELLNFLYISQVED